jgi:hypothetical protein
MNLKGCSNKILGPARRCFKSFLHGLIAVNDQRPFNFLKRRKDEVQENILADFISNSNTTGTDTILLKRSVNSLNSTYF